MKHFTLSAFCAVCVFTSQAQIVEPGFEGGPGAYWGEFSTNFQTPLCDAGCGTGGAPRTGTWYAWFGGAGTGSTFPEEGSLYQNILIPSGSSAQIKFWTKIGFAGTSANDYVKVDVDGNTLFTITPADEANYTAYTEVTIDVLPYANNAMHNLTIHGKQFANGGSSIHFDDFSLVVNGNILTGVFDAINRETPFTLFPNPTSDLLNLQFNQTEGNVQVNILGMDGKLISSEQLNNVYNRTFTLDTSRLASGLYQLQVSIGNEVSTERFVVSK